MKTVLKVDKNGKNYDKEIFTKTKTLKVILSKYSSKTNKKKKSFSKSKSNPKKK